MTEPTPLDPDQVQCPTCGVDPAQVCRQPSGRRARSVHAARRRAAERGQTRVPRATRPQTSPPAKGKPFDSKSASSAARKSAQNRRRRKAEIAAEVEQKRADAEQAAIDQEATKLAEDASRFARDRALLRRNVLDAATKATTRLIESLDGLQRVDTNEDGTLITAPKETTNRAGDRVVVESPVVRGWANSATVERLAKVAASTLNSLRLEEGKPTGIERHETAGTADALGELGVEELIEFARRNLPGDQS